VTGGGWGARALAGGTAELAKTVPPLTVSSGRQTGLSGGNLRGGTGTVLTRAGGLGGNGVGVGRNRLFRRWGVIWGGFSYPPQASGQTDWALHCSAWGSQKNAHKKKTSGKQGKPGGRYNRKKKWFWWLVWLKEDFLGVALPVAKVSFRGLGGQACPIKWAHFPNPGLGGKRGAGRHALLGPKAGGVGGNVETAKGWPVRAPAGSRVMVSGAGNQGHIAGGQSIAR